MPLVFLGHALGLFPLILLRSAVGPGRTFIVFDRRHSRSIMCLGLRHVSSCFPHCCLFSSAATGLHRADGSLVVYTLCDNDNDHSFSHLSVHNAVTCQNACELVPSLFGEKETRSVRE